VHLVRFIIRIFYYKNPQTGFEPKETLSVSLMYSVTRFQPWQYLDHSGRGEGLMDGLRATLSFIHFLITRPVGVHRRPDPAEGIWLHQHHRWCKWQHGTTQKYFLLTNVRTVGMIPCTKMQSITVVCMVKSTASDTEHRLHTTIHFPYSLRHIKRRDRMDDISAFVFIKFLVQFSARRPAFLTDKFSRVGSRFTTGVTFSNTWL
jgi:hypothetical protein